MKFNTKANNPISKKQALKMMLGLLFMVILFHIAIMTYLIPYTLIWGGKLKTESQMYLFETTAISINLFLMILLLLKGNYIKNTISNNMVNGTLWIFLVIFALNTFGNIMAETMFEKIAFTPLSLISALLVWRILKG